MKCKNCKRQIEDFSVFCNWCGTRQIKEKEATCLAKPRKLSSGKYSIQIMIDGKRISATKDTAKEATQWAKEQKAMAKEKAANPAAITLQEAVDTYIESRKNILSPSTIRPYLSMARFRFSGLRDKRVCDITDSMMQEAINKEAETVSVKTLHNAYGLFSAACEQVCGVDYKITLPKKKVTQHSFIEPCDIVRALEQFRGKRSEAAVLLGLHSLRLSEIKAITREDIRDGAIYVHASVVNGSDGEVRREQNKTASSTRRVPILIPRLLEVLDDIPISISDRTLFRDIENTCAALGIPNIGIHGLRHSFASLCHYLGISELQCQAWGGWSSNNVLRQVYTHLSEEEEAESKKQFADFFQITK